MTNNIDLDNYIRERLIMDANGKYTNLHKIISDPEMLKYAYLSIKSKPGNMVPGVSKTTLDGIDLK